MTTLLTECNPTVICDCIRVKSVLQKINFGNLSYDLSDINIGIPTELYPKIAKLFFQQKDKKNILQNSIFYEKISNLVEEG